MYHSCSLFVQNVPETVENKIKIVCMSFDFQSSNWKSIVFIVVIFNIFLYLVFNTIIK